MNDTLEAPSALGAFVQRIRQAEIKPTWIAGLIVGALIVWLAVPTPGDLTDPAWHLFIIFITTIGLVITNAMPIFVAAIGALAVAILSGVLAPEQAFSGFSKGFILLIAVAFLVARAVVNSGLGNRVAYWMITKLGQTTLGLGYSMVATDVLIAPAFPSNTARSGVLFPITQSLALGSGSRPDAASRKRTGAFLMMTSMAGLSVSSALWLTAMAANPAGAEMAAEHGIEITFGSWFVAASLPSLVAALGIPYVLHRFFRPEVTQTPDAPQIARERLREMGPMSVQEWVTAATFVGLVAGWSMGKWLGINPTAVAFAGLFVLMVTGIFTVRDLRSQGGTLEVLIWFGILYTLSTYLNRFGFMTYLGDIIADLVAGAPWPFVYSVLLVSYVLLHYFFVSQTAQMLALFPVYLAVGIGAGVPSTLMAFMLLFATNFFSCITPQGSSANVIFVGSGYLTTGEVYRYGGIVTLANLAVYGLVGTAWVLLVA
jgi:DASS family divalent anion:Na+ symporter